MFVEQWQHTWQPRDTPLVLITAANSGEAPLLLFRIWNSYFTHMFGKNGSMQLRSKCYKPNTNVSASNASKILYFVARKGWHGVLELLGAKREWDASYPDRHFEWIPSLRLAKWLHTTLREVITPTPKYSHIHKPLTFRQSYLLLHNIGKCRNVGPKSRHLE